MPNSRNQSALLVLALLCGAGLLAGPPAAGGEELWFMLDTGDAGEPATLWPDRVVVDAKSWMLLAVWNGSPPVEEAIAMSDVTRIQRAQPWEGRPDEVIAHLRDGRKVLLARGGNASTAATLLSAVVGRTVEVVPPGSEWPEATRTDGKTPDTSLALGSVRSGAAVATLIEDEQARRAAEGAQATASRTVVIDDEKLPANADPNALSAAMIKATVQQQMAQIRQCYQREFQRNPSLRGKVVVRFLIEENGSVSGARLRESSMENPVVEQCIVDEIAGMTFPKPQAGKVVPVSFPFSFTGG